MRVRLIPRCDRANTIQPPIVSWIEASQPVCPERVHSTLDGIPYDRVDMPVVLQGKAVPVVGAERAARPCPIINQWEQGIEVSFRCPLANHNEEPQRQLFARFLQLGRFMVGGYAGLQVGLQAQSAYTRRMTVLAAPPGYPQLVANDAIAGKGTRHIHKLAQSNRFRPCEHLCDLVSFEFGSRTLVETGGNAGWSGKAHMKGKTDSCGAHRFHARKPGHIGNLVRVGHDRPGPMWNHRARKFWHPEQRAFRVNVRIDKRRRDDLAPTVDQLGRSTGIAHGGDTAVGNRYRLLLQLASEDIEHLPTDQRAARTTRTACRCHSHAPTVTIEATNHVPLLCLLLRSKLRFDFGDEVVDLRKRLAHKRADLRRPIEGKPVGHPHGHARFVFAPTCRLIRFQHATRNIGNDPSRKPFKRSTAPFAIFFREEPRRDAPDLDDIPIVFEAHIGLALFVIHRHDPTLAIVEHAVGVKALIGKRLPCLRQQLLLFWSQSIVGQITFETGVEVFSHGLL